MQHDHNSTFPQAASDVDRSCGVLLGLAAGDLNGGPTQFAIRLATSLLDRRAFDADDVLHRYVSWFHSGAFDTGPVAWRALQLVSEGTPVDAATDLVHQELQGRTAGCGPAHRSPVLAMAKFLGAEELGPHAVLEASLTHRDALAGDVATASVRLCRELILHADWRCAVERAAQDRDPRTQAALALGDEPLDDSGFAPAALRAAIYFVNSHAGFADALTASIRFAGRANYCPVLVGAIAGARWGASRIPSQFLGHCQALSETREIARRLASA